MRRSTTSVAVVAAVALTAPAWAAQHSAGPQAQDQMPAQEAQPAAPQAPEEAEARAGAEAAAEGQAVIGLSREEARDLLGLPVRTTAGNELGTLRGLSLGHGEDPAFAVIEVGGDLEQILGVEQPTITVDADKLTRAPATEELVLNMPMSELEVAPEFLQDFNVVEAAEMPEVGAAEQPAQEEQGQQQ